MVLNEEQWIKELREKRIAYGISQGRLMCILNVGKEADCEMKQLKESEDN